MMTRLSLKNDMPLRDNVRHPTYRELHLDQVNMDDPNITMDEYIRLEEEKALSQGETFNWQTATYGKMDYYEDEDESNDEDYTVIYDKNIFSNKIISVDNLKTDLENDNDKVNMPSFLSPETKVSYSNDLDFFKDFENEFPVIVYNDALTSKLDFTSKSMANGMLILFMDF
ncbi:hypothetical protein Tco_1410988 [Tanacetum coccineum]